MAAANVQHIRLSKPEAPKKPPKLRHQGILQDQLRRTARAPWVPSLSLGFRILLLLRFNAAMYSNIQDCDEGLVSPVVLVYNFWEPLHYLDKGFAFQTWELSPQYAIRSWTYIILHLLPSWISSHSLSLSKVCIECLRPTSEALKQFHPASMLECGTRLQLPSLSNNRRTLLATIAFAAGAIIGWPFSLLIAVPYVFEELFVYGIDRVPPELRTKWQFRRFRRLVTCGLIASTLFIPVVLVDSMAYDKLVLTPWNIIKYNIFGGSERGPDLYGSEPFSFYFLNLLLNFNVLLPLALLSLPSLLITHLVDRKRLGFSKPGIDQSSPTILVAVRLLPMYLWIGVLSVQPHKEERFMFPIYPLLCFNAATTLYLMKGWLEASFISITKSPYRASKSLLFRTFTTSVIILSIVVSISRILALTRYYHAPLDVASHFEAVELPRLLNVTGLISLPDTPQYTTSGHEEKPSIDLSPVKELGLRVCLGKEWYRFPGHYLIPDGIDVQFIKSEFNGLLPRYFESSSGQGRIWKRDGTRVVPSRLNDLNREEEGQYVDVTTCDYLIDLDFPAHPRESHYEPRYAVDSDNWDRVFCAPFLDAAHSSLLTRTLWLPMTLWSEKNSFGDYCLLRERRKALEREHVKH
ncbi:hypothetical protein Clacol_007604 [Clathrus columnatus]|uniref:Mannosyltransferase n=1 Tax=Clathrus columnatus TaxID=1419009 RepID=A0AAV5AFD8_9AGAM|nr:hypothetical protein Clacol_007604 [Clathrus columnatus]